MGSYPRCAPRLGRCEGRQGVVCVRVCLAEASVGLRTVVQYGSTAVQLSTAFFLGTTAVVQPSANEDSHLQPGSRVSDPYSDALGTCMYIGPFAARRVHSEC